MSYAVIDTQSQKTTITIVFFKEHVDTKLTLVYTDKGQFGILYDVKFSGVKSGHVQGGPEIVTGNETVVVHNSPKVDVTVSKFADTGSHISMNIKAVLHKSGSHTLFDQTLAGNYTAKSGWAAIVQAIEEAAEKSEPQLA